MSRSALLLRLTGVGRIVLLSVKNKGNRWLLKLKLHYWYILTSKRFEICRQLLSSLTLCLCEMGVNTTFRVLDLDWLVSDYWQMSTVNSSTIFVADMVIHFGQYGLFVWPTWLWLIRFVAEMVVADMVRGRYGTDPKFNGTIFNCIAWPLIWYLDRLLKLWRISKYYYHFCAVSTMWSSDATVASW